MKTFLIQTALLVTLLLALPIAAEAQFIYTTNNGAITITGYTGPGGAVTIPDTINGLPVTSIGDDAFYHDFNLTSVTIPNSVISIGAEAFFECGLRHVTIPDSVTNIGDSAFDLCDLTNVTIGNGVVSIGDDAFAGDISMTGATIGAGVTRIGNHVFYECESLTTIMVSAQNAAFSSANGVLFNKNQAALVIYPPGRPGSYAIPDGVTNVGNEAFYDCEYLTSVIIPNSVISIGDEAFYDTALTNVTIPASVANIGDAAFESFGLTTFNVDAANLNYSSVDDVLFDKNQSVLVAFPDGRHGSYTIPNSVASIRNEAFENCYTLTNVTIGNGVTSIGSGVFDSCYSLTNVTIGKGVTNIGNLTFYECESLTKITIPDNVISIGSNAFGDSGLTGVTIPDSVISIGNEAFSYCHNLTNVTIGNGVTTIGDEAFFYSGLTGVMIPDSVISIGNEAFIDCFNLTNVTIGNGVATIGDEAFLYSGLTSVAIPDSVISIGNDAFDDCYNLTNVTIGNGVTSIGDGTFFNCGSLASVFFKGNAPLVGPDAFSWAEPEGGGGGYLEVTIFYLSGNTGWSDTFATRPTVMLNAPPQFGTTGDGWEYASDGTQIIITGSSNYGSTLTIPAVIATLPVTGIGPYAFEETPYITNVIIPDSVTTIGGYAFNFCEGLSSVTIPDSVTSIGVYAFSFDSPDHPGGLTSVFFAGNAPTADPTVFDNDPTTVYYLPGTLGWSNTFAGLPTALWFQPQPLILNKGPGFGVQSNQFGFTISWATNVPVVVEACTNLSNPAWIPVNTNTLISGTSSFSDPQTANLPGRFYRLRSSQ